MYNDSCPGGVLKFRVLEILKRSQEYFLCGGLLSLIKAVCKTFCAIFQNIQNCYFIKEPGKLFLDAIAERSSGIFGKTLKYCLQWVLHKQRSCYQIWNMCTPQRRTKDFVKYIRGNFFHEISKQLKTVKSH